MRGREGFEGNEAAEDGSCWSLRLRDGSLGGC